MNDISDMTKNNNSSVYNTLFRNNQLNIHDNKIKNVSSSFNLQKNFLTLLIAQIQNQDPIDPIKNTELTTQLAQINTVGQIEKLNNTVEQLKNQSTQNKKIETSSLIGHHVMTLNSQLIHTQGTTEKFGVELMNHAKLTKITIQNSVGKIVFVKHIKNLPVGLSHFVWDGKDTDKKDTDTGKYIISATAENNNKNITTNIFRDAVVHGIVTNASNSSNIVLDLGEKGTATLDNVHEIFA